MAKRVKVIHKPGGYEPWKDQIPIRTPNYRAIMIIVSVIFACGFIASLLVVLPSLNTPAPLPTQYEVLKGTMKDDSLVPTDSPFSLSVSDPLPTVTVTNTPVPTIDYMAMLATAQAMTPNRVEVTVEIVEPTEAPPTNIPTLAADLESTLTVLEAEVRAMQSQTPVMVTVPPIRNAGVAVVIVEVALVRRLPGTGYRALYAANLGTELRLTGESRAGWYEVFYRDGIGWIWGELIRIEAGQ